MSTKLQKFIAKQELERRRIRESNAVTLRIIKLPTEELEKIVNEPDEENEV